MRLTLDPNVDPYSLLGTTFDLFDWPAALSSNNRFRSIEMTGKTIWDFSKLYTTGEVKLIAVPEPTGAILAAMGLFSVGSWARCRKKWPKAFVAF